MTVFVHHPADRGYDSRQYDSKRRSNTFGYYQPPAVNDTLTFTLPPFSRMIDRLVSMGSKTWQLWSPNSTLHAFYPGVRAPKFEVTMEESREKRRFDGHLGRFDYTKSPQHYDPRRPWLGFIRRDKATSSKIEHVPLFLAWDSHLLTKEAGDLGTINTAFLIQLTTRNFDLDTTIEKFAEVATIVPSYWTDRPLSPTIEEVRQLQGLQRFASAVDTAAAIQRGMKLKSAWIRAMDIVVRERKGAVHTEWLSKVPFAAEDFMGVWINGSKEEEATWLLKHKVPCYVIHEIPLSELYAFTEDHKYLDFVTKTDAQLLDREHSGFEHIAHKTFALFNDTPDHGGIPSLDLVLQPQDRVLSDPVAQGWLNDHHAALGEVPEVSMRAVSVRMSPAPVQTVSKEGLPPVPEPEARVIAADRVEWLVPPPVMVASKGKWSMWEEWIAEGDNMFLRLTFSRPQGCEEVYYDRKERREIFIVEPIDIPLGAVSDVNLYGIPAPVARFVEVVDGSIVKEYPASHWLYRTLAPTSGTAGLEARTPSPHELPLTASLSKKKIQAHPLQPGEATTNSPIPLNPTPSIEPSKAIPTEPRAHRQKRSNIAGKPITTGNRVLVKPS